MPKRTDPVKCGGSIGACISEQTFLYFRVYIEQRSLFLLGYQDIGINFCHAMSGRLQGRVYAAPKHRSRVLTTQLVDSSRTPVRRSEDMEVDNPRVPDRGSEGMEAGLRGARPGADATQREQHDLNV